MKRLIYFIFGNPIPKCKGFVGTNSGKLIMDKKIFYKREDVKKVIKKIQDSNNNSSTE